MSEISGVLAGVRVVECSLLSPSGVGQHLADLGADVIKVEMPGEGDYVRRVSWPMIGGISLEHWHWNRGKRSIALDLRTDDGVGVFLDLVRHADAVIEGMRHGALDRRGLTWDRLHAANPAVVLCRLSGYGNSGPYRDIPSHGLAFDSIAGIAPPATTADGFVSIPRHTSVGMHAGALYGAFGLVSAVLYARTTGEGRVFEVAQADAAIAWNWLHIEGAVAYERPEDEVSGSTGDGVRRAIGFDDFADAVRYQYYATSDGHVLFMASERKFWRNFCDAVGRLDLYEGNPGREVADHALGNTQLRAALVDIFRTKSTGEWMAFGEQADVPIAPVYDASSLRADPHVEHRTEWLAAATHGADLTRTPIKFLDHPLPAPSRAPTVGQHTDDVLRDVLRYEQSRIDSLRAAGAIA
jgi:crotonobetainyl-CoA:carnitine CoA-transferase CaiB-like acyl-CoA transferase